jgi:hypothetical protein
MDFASILRFFSGDMVFVKVAYTAIVLKGSITATTELMAKIAKSNAAMPIAKLILVLENINRLLNGF